MTYDDLFRPESGSGWSDALDKRSPRLYMTHESSAPSVVAFRSTSGRPALTVSSAPNLCQCKRNTHEIQASGQSITPRGEGLTRSSFGSPPVDASWWLGGLSLQGTRSGTRTFHCRGLCNATARIHIYADLDLITDKYNGPFVLLWFQCRKSFPSDSTCKIQLFVDVCADGLTVKGIKWRRKKQEKSSAAPPVLTCNSYIRCHPCHHIHSGIMFLDAASICSRTLSRCMASCFNEGSKAVLMQ